MSRLGLILLTTLTLAWASAWAEKATTYRWVDENGKVHYGDSIPASQVDLGHREIDSLGRTVRTQERTRLSPAERQQRLDQELKRQTAQRQEAEQNRHDNALISTYANVEEIDLARDRAISLEENQLRGLRSQLNTALDKFAHASKQLHQDEVLGLKSSAGLVQMRNEASTDIALYKGMVERREKIIVELKGRYEADKKRYIDLKAKLAH